jgi:hypothetical protein
MACVLSNILFLISVGIKFVKFLLIPDSLYFFIVLESNLQLFNQFGLDRVFKNQKIKCLSVN